MLPDLDIGFGVRIPARELALSYSRSGGPGGQNVNKVETKVTVRFAALRSPVLPAWARALVVERLGHRLTKEGELLVTSERHRDRARNVAAALARLTELLQGALRPVTPRKPTAPTRGSERRRLETKRRRSGHKSARRKQEGVDDE